jgi:hypothetical protein
MQSLDLNDENYYNGVCAEREGCVWESDCGKEGEMKRYWVVNKFNVCLSIYHLSIYLSIYLSSIYLPTYLPTYLTINIKIP